MRGLKVRGTGRVELSPDMAMVTLGVRQEAATAVEAQALAATRMRDVLTAIGAAGVAEADIATDHITLEPTLDYAGPSPRTTGFQAVQAVRVRVRELARLGPIVDAAVAAGSNELTGVTLGLTDPTVARASARTLAMAAARASAESLAEAAGVRLGLPIAILEEEDRPDGPMHLKMADTAMLSGTPVAAGRTTIEVTVRVRYAILG